MKKKFTVFNDSHNIDEFNSFASSNVYVEQDFQDFKRLQVWATTDCIKYLLQLIDETKEPYGIMYILRNSRCGNEEARYISPTVDYEELKSFLEKFADFFEYDSRHRVLIKVLSEELTYFVYDEENMLFAYGDVDEFKNILNKCGFKEYKNPLALPDRHMHMFKKEFDKEENEIVNYLNWIKDALQEIDEDTYG